MYQKITPASKAELKAAITSQLDGYSYNYFTGEIRKGDRYACLSYSFNRASKVSILVTYWKDGESTAVEFASHCGTPAGVANKVAKFLNLK